MRRIITIETDSRYAETILSALQKMEGVGKVEIINDYKLEETQSSVSEPQTTYECIAPDETAEKRKQEILEDIRQGLLEVKLAREGKIQLQSVRDFLNELRD